MPEYLSPGVYVEEVSGGIKAIEGVGTSTGAFVGRAVKGPVSKAMLITNVTQFLTTFGGVHQDYYLAYAVRHFFAEGGTRCYVVRAFKRKSVNNPPDLPSGVAEATLKDLAQNNVLTVFATSPGEWGNNIRLQVGDPAFDPTNVLDTKRFSLTVLYQSDPNAEPVVVETFGQLSMKEFIGPFPNPTLPNPMHVEAQINGISKYIEVRDLSTIPTIDDPPQQTAKPIQLAGGNNGDRLSPNDLIGGPSQGPGLPATGLSAFDVIDDINIVAIPDLVHANLDSSNPRIDARIATKAAFTYCENRKDCFFIADTVRGLTPQEAREYKQGQGNFQNAGGAFNTSYSAIYYPWIFANDPLTNKSVLFPPSGAVAGTYSATDVRRGVHKAPAGTEDPLNVADGVERVVTKGEQDTLNPAGINVIRSFPESGIVIWGARTMSADPEWKYINVRRLFLFLEESIDEGTQWVVFEPNDQRLWKRIERNISAFLRIQWQEEKFFGDKPEKAYFVKCDEETNPPESIDLGRVITVIGVAPVKPAEFVIFRIMQARPGSAT
jgi:phage tail sheath protein FI